MPAPAHEIVWSNRPPISLRWRPARAEWQQLRGARRRKGVMTDETEERLWLEVYDARQRYFESVLGPLPGDILKMLNMTGVWPGGGLYVIPASKLGGDVWVYITFGLSNYDMPTGIALTKTEFADGKVKTTLEKREPAARAMARPATATRFCWRQGTRRIGRSASCNGRSRRRSSTMPACSGASSGMTG
jgi:hypothetical protein